jgi:polyferredoxin
MMVLPLLLALLWGKLHCGWLCPFGAVGEFLFRLTPGRLALSETWDGRLRRLRLLLLVGLPATAIVAADPGVLRFEPLSALFHPRSLSVTAGVLLGWVLVGSVFVERFYCKFLCPVGALADLVSADRLLGRKPGLVCGGCVRAEKGCRYLREEGEDYRVRRDRLRGDCVC